MTTMIAERYETRTTSRDVSSRPAACSITTAGLSCSRLASIVASLDGDRCSLQPIRDQLAESGVIGAERLGQMETSFLQFAALTAVAEHPVCPSSYEDEFWHQFILNTRLYNTWCLRHFGRFLHHRPGKQTDFTVQYTQALKAKYFSVDSRLAATCTGNNCGNSSCGNA